MVTPTGPPELVAVVFEGCGGLGVVGAGAGAMTDGDVDRDVDRDVDEDVDGEAEVGCDAEAGSVGVAEREVDDGAEADDGAVALALPSLPTGATRPSAAKPQSMSFAA